MSKTNKMTQPMRDLRGYMTPKQVQKLINSPKSPRDKLILRLLWATGCRVSELVGDVVKEKGEVKKIFKGLLIQNIIWDEDVIILDTLKRKQYPPPQRRVAMDAITMQMLKEFVGPRQQGKLFGITRQRVFQIIRKAAKIAGIKQVGNKKIHPHHLRHSHCVAWIRDNPTMEGLRRLQERLNHASFATTALYFQFASSKKEVEKTFGKW